MTQPFHENVVIITGASAGIGEALALQLADQGAWLALAARNAERLEVVAAACRARGGRAEVIPTDVSDEAQCKQLVAQTVAAYGRIDTLIANAGVSMWARLDEMESLEPFRKIMQVNYFGAVYCTYYALPYLKATNGRIVGIASITGRVGVPSRTGYAASKIAMARFFDSLRIELMPNNVSVTVIYPDFVATEVRERAFGPDGQPAGGSPVREDKIMTAEKAAQMTLNAAAARKRDLILSFRGKLAQWAKLIVPGIVDRMALRAIEKH